MNEHFSRELINTEHAEAIASAERFGPLIPARADRFRLLRALTRIVTAVRPWHLRRRHANSVPPASGQRANVDFAPSITDPHSV